MKSIFNKEELEALLSAAEKNILPELSEEMVLLRDASNPKSSSNYMAPTPGLVLEHISKLYIFVVSEFWE